MASISNAASISKSRRLVGNTLINLFGALLIGSSAAKFAGVAPVVAQLAAVGFEGGRLEFIAILEMASALLFMFPRTRSFGLLLVSSYLGGAIATHVGHGQAAAFQPAIVLAFFWLAAWLRHPQILWSFRGSAKTVGDQVEARLASRGA